MFSNPFSFSGRVGRAEFIYSCAIILLSAMWLKPMMDDLHVAYFIYISWVTAVIFLIWFFVAQSIKRCHDIGKPWFWVCIPFYILYLVVAPGQKAINIYGLDQR